MKTARNFIYIYLAVLLLSYMTFRILLPDLSVINSLYPMFIFLPLMSCIFVPLLANGNKTLWKNINLGLLYYIIMAIIMVMGNLNIFILKYFNPSYEINIGVTNYYWMGGMVAYSLGFLFYKSYFLRKYQNLKIVSYRKLSNTVIITLFLLSAIGTFYSYLALGFVPFLEGAGSGLRYTSGVASVSLPLRLFSLNVATSVLGIMYFVNRRNIFILLLALFSFFSSFFFITRIYPYLIACTVIIIIYYIVIKSIKVKVLLVFAIIIAFVFINYLFLDHRVTDLNILAHRPDISLFQRILIYSINEYRQLDRFIFVFDAEKALYGSTLWGIPVGFIPRQILIPFGIVKSEIMANNSAVIFANYIGSLSTGVRVGLLGELYLNFKYYGVLFMFFVGVIIGVLQKAINLTHTKDYRYGFYLIFFSIMVYALLGQSNTIGSVFAENIFALYVLLLFVRPQKNDDT